MTSEQEIRAIIQQHQDAIRSKNVDRIMALYDPEAVLFDVKPPFQITGAAAYRRTWEECLPYFPEPNSFGFETRDLAISVSGDMAFAHWLFRFTGDPDHPAMKQWMRITSVARRRNGAWKVVHEHLSVPFDRETGKAVLTLKV